MPNPRDMVSALVVALIIAGWAAAANLVQGTHDVLWEQVAAKPALIIFPEREAFSSLDRAGRFIVAAQVGTVGEPPQSDDLASFAVQWTVKRGDEVLAARTQPIPQGMIDVRFGVGGLVPGRYDLHAKLLRGEQAIQEAEGFFRVVEAEAPGQSGRVPLVLPRGVSLGAGSFPLHGGVPMPKGALWDPRHVRVVDRNGREHPCGVVVRSRWGSAEDASIRWLGLDFQAESAPAYWPDRSGGEYFLEFGPRVQPASPPQALQVSQTPEGLAVDTGAMQFLVRQQGFNLIDQVRVGGQAVMQSSPRHGLYIVDHEGATYRAANDSAVTLSVEERTDLRVVVRAEGWYVKDGSDGSQHSYTLPTDRISKFITRIEAYAGKPYVRVLSTWVLTFDPFTVRLRDVGMSLPTQGCDQATFGVEGGAPRSWEVPAQGLYLLQHLPDSFAVETADGKALGEGQRSAGWVTARGKSGLLSVGHRETWQRFPKEIEVLPDAVRFHLWPAHGRTRENFDPLRHEEIHKLWFCHQGRELNLAQPMDYYYATAAIVDNPSTGVYKGAGTAMAGVFSSAMGAAITSDLMIHFAAADVEAADVAQAFQAAPHVLADPAWTCASEAIGYLHPYDPQRFANAEEEIVDYTRGYWETQDRAGEYGMWLYRPWHHSAYKGDGKWELYRLYNAAHHYEPYMPWMLYARSGDPFYLTQGSANIRILTDLQIVHYNDPAYPHREFHTGQARLAGSTRHTNGFNLWGGDHGVLGHHTCYNGIILAHYLTGDLRLREVIEDEWQKTIVSDRANPEFAQADRTNRSAIVNAARDKNTALGELLDLYQFTHHPAVLALVKPNLDHFLNDFIRPWGMPQHNAIQLYCSQQAGQRMIEAVDERLGPTDAFKDPMRAWFTHAPHENMALALILQPQRSDVMFANYLSIRRGGDTAQAVRQQKPDAEAFCYIPDRVNFLPRVMYAMAQARVQLPIAELDQRVECPNISKSDRQGLRCIVREDVDADFNITFFGRFQAAGFPLQVHGPDGNVVLDTQVPGNFQSPFVVTVPRDGQVGQYVFFIRQPGHNGPLFLPLTTLPGEIYQLATWVQGEASRFFVRFDSQKAAPFVCGAPSHDFVRFSLTQLDGRPLAESQWVEIVDKAGKSTGKKQPLIKTELPAEGAWLDISARSALYVQTPFVFSVDPQRWFAPSREALSLKNAQGVK